MATFPQAFYISLVAPIDGSLEFTTDPFDPGPNQHLCGATCE
ncbi:hypothetical protein HDG42_000434 [Paraburkholderia sp. JPY171]|nr:hypothetical protein [Paraburkholderia atlantica]